MCKVMQYLFQDYRYSVNVLKSSLSFTHYGWSQNTFQRSSSWHFVDQNKFYPSSGGGIINSFTDNPHRSSKIYLLCKLK